MLLVWFGEWLVGSPLITRTLETGYRQNEKTPGAGPCARAQARKETFVQPFRSAHRDSRHSVRGVSVPGCRVLSPCGFRATPDAGMTLADALARGTPGKVTQAPPNDQTPVPGPRLLLERSASTFSATAAFAAAIASIASLIVIFLVGSPTIMVGSLASNWDLSMVIP